jgi:uncharacterized protein (DUF2141 family)
VTFVLPGVPAGKYAISIAHDQNNDGKLERHRFLKYPLEGAGASNYLTPPRFAPFHHEAVFEVQRAGNQRHGADALSTGMRVRPQLSSWPGQPAADQRLLTL